MYGVVNVIENRFQHIAEIKGKTKNNITLSLNSKVQQYKSP